MAACKTFIWSSSCVGRVDGHAKGGRETWSRRGDPRRPARRGRKCGHDAQVLRHCQLGGVSRLARRASRPARAAASPVVRGVVTSLSQKSKSPLLASALRTGRLELGHRPRQLPEVPDHAMGRRRAAGVPAVQHLDHPHAGGARALHVEHRVVSDVHRAPAGTPRCRSVRWKISGAGLRTRPRRRTSGGRTGRAGRETPGPSAGRARASASCSTARPG